MSTTFRNHHWALARLALLVGLAAFWTSSAAAQDQMYRLYRAAPYLGRGDTGVAIADDQEAIYYNPAGLALGKGLYKKTVLLSPQVDVSTATKDLAKQISSKSADAVDTVSDHVGKPNHLGVQNLTALVMRRAAISALVSGQADLLAYKSKDQGGLEVVDANAVENLALGFSLADSFFQERLFLGITAKYLQRSRGEIEASAAEAQQVQEKLKDQANFLGVGTGGGADLGAMWKFGGRMQASVGAVVHDVGGTHVTPQQPTNLDLSVKQLVDIGIALEPATKSSRLKLLADYDDVLGAVVKDPFKRTHFGAEIGLFNMFGASGGLSQGYPTAGIFIDLYFLRLDLATYTVEDGSRAGTRPDPRYAIRITAGF